MEKAEKLKCAISRGQGGKGNLYGDREVTQKESESKVKERLPYLLFDEEDRQVKIVVEFYGRHCPELRLDFSEENIERCFDKDTKVGVELQALNRQGKKNKEQNSRKKKIIKRRKYLLDSMSLYEKLMRKEKSELSSFLIDEKEDMDLALNAFFLNRLERLKNKKSKPLKKKVAKEFCGPVDQERKKRDLDMLKEATMRPPKDVTEEEQKVIEYFAMKLIELQFSALSSLKDSDPKNVEVIVGNLTQAVKKTFHDLDEDTVFKSMTSNIKECLVKQFSAMFSLKGSDPEDVEVFFSHLTQAVKKTFHDPDDVMVLKSMTDDMKEGVVKQVINSPKLKFPESNNLTFCQLVKAYISRKSSKARHKICLDIINNFENIIRLDREACDKVCQSAKKEILEIGVKEDGLDDLIIKYSTILNIGVQDRRIGHRKFGFIATSAPKELLCKIINEFLRDPQRVYELIKDSGFCCKDIVLSGQECQDDLLVIFDKFVVNEVEPLENYECVKRIINIAEKCDSSKMKPILSKMIAKVAETEVVTTTLQSCQNHHSGIYLNK